MTRQGGREDEKKTQGKTRSTRRRKNHLSYLTYPPPSFFWLAPEPGQRRVDTGGTSRRQRWTVASLVQREEDGQMTMAMMQKRSPTHHAGLIWLEL